MQQQLLRITNLPIQYQYQIEPARLEMKSSAKAQANIKRDAPDLRIKTKPLRVKLNTDAMYESMDIRTPDAWAREYANKGMQTSYEAIGEYAEMGNQMARIDKGVTIAQIVQNKMIEQPTSYTTFLPSVGPEISWDKNEINMNYDEGSTEIDWQIMKNIMDYIPGKFSIEILQMPKVSIEYIGDFLYVPPSANPNYEETPVA